MPKTILRQFTGGISNEIDAQNLRDDQGEEAIDINLKGFALEPGDGISPLTDAKHYYYRGEWIEDSEAVSFEESGVGVVKTYDTGRPQFEEIINETSTGHRDLGPPLPPDSTITGTIVSEGTRGESAGDGAHLLTLPGEKLGSMDTADPITDAPSLVEHRATPTTNIDHIYYYDGQPYWVEKSSGTWYVKTRQRNTSAPYLFNSNDPHTSGSLTHHSGGSFFKDSYFICWDAQYIEVVALQNAAMTVDTTNTLDTDSGGNQGSSLGVTTAATGGFTTEAVAKEISSVDVCEDNISFIQRIETAERKTYGTLGNSDYRDYRLSKYTNSDDERWILPRKNDSYLLLLRDGFAYEWGGDGNWNLGKKKAVATEATGGNSFEADGAYNLGTDEERAVEIITNTGGKRAVSWITPQASSGSHWSSRGQDWTNDIGIKYIVEYLPKGEWACVRQLGVNKPEILVIEAKGKTLTAQNAKDITVTRTFSETAVSQVVNTKSRDGSGDWHYETYQNFRLNVHVDMTFPGIGGSIHWTGNPVPETQMSWTNNASHQDNSSYSGYSYGTHRRVTKSHWYGGTGFSWAGYSETSFTRITILDVEYTNHHGPASELTKRKRWVRTIGLDIGQGKWPNGKGDDAYWDPQKFQTGPKYTGGWVGGHTPGRLRSGKRAILYRHGTFTGARGLAENIITHPIANAGDSGVYKNEIIRLCSKPAIAGSITLGTYGSQSTIHTKATIAKEGTSISFAEAESTNFVVGDYIRVSDGKQNNRYRRLSSNIPVSSTGNFGRSFIAKIKSMVSGKLRLEAIPNFEDRFMVGVDEECYPIITTIDNHVKNSWEKSITAQTRELIRTDLSSNTLLGCSHGRKYTHAEMGTGDKQLIEVRSNVAARHASLPKNYAHQINWQGDNTIRAVNLGNGDPIIVYIEDEFLKSQLGSASNRTSRQPPKAAKLSDKAAIYLTSTLMSVVDNKIITVYDPLFGAEFSHGKPKKPVGLGLSESTVVVDVFHVDNASVGTNIFVKIKKKKNDDEETVFWKMVKPGSVKPETTLLGYNFTKPIAFDGTYAWGILKTSSGTYDIHTTVPFYESELEQSWINYSAYSGGGTSGTANAFSAWGQVLRTRVAGDSGGGTNKRYLSIDWKYDSGVYNGTGTPVIGLAHEAGKMIGVNNEFTWYLKDYPDTLQDGTSNHRGTIIASPKMSIKFNSAVTRDVVFFKSQETSLPPSGAVGYENRLTFNNYEIASQDFYVENANHLTLIGGDDADEKGYQMIQSAKIDATHPAFDASRVGISSFLIGAPNMYNPYGPNIDFYYRASFIDKWNHESVPSKLPESGIMPLDSADDCIQLSFSHSFFRWDNPYIEKIRLYRYGGDSSEFMFLRDIDMPGAEIPLAIEKPTGGIFNGVLTRKGTLSPFYNLKTYFDISVLSTLTNSTFDLTAIPADNSASDIDGSWRINQVYEAESPTATYSSVLKANVDLDGEVIIVELASISAAWVTNAPTGVIKIEKEYISYTGANSTTNKLTGCVRGIYGSKASTHSADDTTDGGSPESAVVVEWVLEMEHRNQDTTTFNGVSSEAGTPWETTAVPGTVAVKNTELFDPTNGTFQIGNQLINYTSRTIDPPHFLGCTHNSSNGAAAKAHADGVTVFSFNETYTETSYTSIQIEVKAFGYRDKARTPIMSLHSMQEDNWPPLPMAFNEESKKFYETDANDDFFRYITAVGSLYFGSVDADLRFSRYGTPEYWPLEAVVTLDSKIQNIKEHAGEGIVFTTNSVYRVRGTDPKAMIAFRVPDAKGIMEGDRHSVAEFNGGLIWKTASDGLCMYSGGRVSYITRDKHDIPIMNLPYSCVADGSYWLFQRPKANKEEGDTGNGFRLDITSGDMRLCETTIQAYYAYFAKALGKAIVVTSDNSLSSESGITHAEDLVVEEIGGTKIPRLSWRSKKIDAGDPAVSKAFGSLAIVYESLGSQTATTATNGIRGQALAADLLDLDPDNLDAGDLNDSALDGASDLYDVFTKYDSVGQEFVADIGGTNWNSTQRRTIVMPVDFDTSTVNVGDSVWNELLADNTTVESVSTTVTVELIAGGTNYGNDDGSGGFTIGYIDAEYFTDAGGKLELHGTGDIIANGSPVILKSSGNLPAGLSEGVPYFVVNSSVRSYTATLKGISSSKMTFALNNHKLHDNTAVVISDYGGSYISNGSTYYVRPGIQASSSMSSGIGDSFTLSTTVNGQALFGGGYEEDFTITNGFKYQLATVPNGTPISIGSSSLGVVTGLVNSNPVWEDTNDNSGTNEGYPGWVPNQTYTNVPQDESSGSGTGVQATIVTDASGNLTVTITNGGSGYVNYEKVRLSGYSNTPLDKWVDVEVIVDNTIIGTGTPSFNGCIFSGTSGGGTGFYGTYEVNNSTGAITDASIGNAGTGYTDSPTVVIGDPGSANTGSGAIIEATVNAIIILDKEPLRSGDGDIVWGDLPQVHIYINNESVPERSFTLPPIVSEEPQSADLYLDDLKKFRTISVKVEGNLRINTISLRHFPVQQFQSQTLHHSADIFYKGIVDFRVMLDGDLIYRKELANAGTEFTEERIYLPASSFGSRVHYMNESSSGMIESVTFNGSLAA